MIKNHGACVQAAPHSGAVGRASSTQGAVEGLIFNGMLPVVRRSLSRNNQAPFRRGKQLDRLIELRLEQLLDLRGPAGPRRLWMRLAGVFVRLASQILAIDELQPPPPQ